MGREAVRRLYAQALLSDEVLRSVVSAWLAAMSPDECEEALVDYADLIDPNESDQRLDWIVRTRADAALLRRAHLATTSLH